MVLSGKPEMGMWWSEVAVLLLFKAICWVFFTICTLNTMKDKPKPQGTNGYMTMPLEHCYLIPLYMFSYWLAYNKCF